VPERPPKMFTASPNKQRNISIEENTTASSKQYRFTSETSIIKIRLENSEDKVNAKRKFLSKMFSSHLLTVQFQGLVPLLDMP